MKSENKKIICLILFIIIIFCYSLSSAQDKKTLLLYSIFPPKEKKSFEKEFIIFNQEKEKIFGEEICPSSNSKKESNIDERVVCIDKKTNELVGKYSDKVDFYSRHYKIGSNYFYKKIVNANLFLIGISIVLILIQVYKLRKIENIINQEGAVRIENHVLYYILVMPVIIILFFYLNKVFDLLPGWGGAIIFAYGAVAFFILYVLSTITYFIIKNKKIFGVKKVLYELFKIIIFVILVMTIYLSILGGIIF